MQGFEWDATKDASNRRKHGLSFEEAASIFAGPVLSGPDPHEGEARERSFGLVGGAVVICVIHTDRGDKVRIISARRATANEKRLFHAYLERALG
jgi:uncharacterized DUF497 family protein